MRQTNDDHIEKVEKVATSVDLYYSWVFQLGFHRIPTTHFSVKSEQKNVT